MRYNVGDIVKYTNGKLFIGKIIFNSFAETSHYLIEVETYGERFYIYKSCVIQNITEETEKENIKNDIESKVNALRRFAFSINVGDYIVPYSDCYEKVLEGYFNRNILCNFNDSSRLIYCADTVYKVMKSDINGFIFKVIKSREYKTGSILVVPTEKCESYGYFLITDFIPEDKKELEEKHEEAEKNSLAESLAIIAKCDRCSNNVIITCTQKSNEERLREENERLKKELDLAKKSEKHLEICENALLEKDAEIEKLRKENEQIIENEKTVYKKLWKCQNTLDQIANFIEKIKS